MAEIGAVSWAASLARGLPMFVSSLVAISLAAAVFSLVSSVFGWILAATGSTMMLSLSAILSCWSGCCAVADVGFVTPLNSKEIFILKINCK